MSIASPHSLVPAFQIFGDPGNRHASTRAAPFVYRFTLRFALLKNSASDMRGFPPYSVRTPVCHDHNQPIFRHDRVSGMKPGQPPPREFCAGNSRAALHARCLSYPLAATVSDIVIPDHRECSSDVFLAPVMSTISSSLPGIHLLRSDEQRSRNRDETPAGASRRHLPQLRPD